MNDVTRLRLPPLVSIVTSDMLVELIDVANKNRPIRAPISLIQSTDLLTVINPTGDVTLTAADTGTIITNIAMGGPLLVNLPASADDIWFGFVIVLPYSIKINPLDSEVIGDGIAGKYMEMTTVGVIVLANYLNTIWTIEQDTCLWEFEL